MTAQAPRCPCQSLPASFPRPEAVVHSNCSYNQLQTHLSVQELPTRHFTSPDPKLVRSPNILKPHPFLKMREHLGSSLHIRHDLKHNSSPMKPCGGKAKRVGALSEGLAELCLLQGKEGQTGNVPSRQSALEGSQTERDRAQPAGKPPAPGHSSSCAHLLRGVHLAECSLHSCRPAGALAPPLPSMSDLSLALSIHHSPAWRREGCQSGAPEHKPTQSFNSSAKPPDPGMQSLNQGKLPLGTVGSSSPKQKPE